MANFTKSDLITSVSQTTGHARKDVEEIIAVALSVIRDEADIGNMVAIHGFGRFSVKERPARAGRNPATGEAIQIPASRVLNFKPSKSST